MAARNTGLWIVCSHLLSVSMACSSETAVIAVSAGDPSPEADAARTPPSQEAPDAASSSAAPPAASPPAASLPSEPEPEPDASSEPEPSVPIAGRWGMAGFADPVGVQIFEADGVLSGDGCAAGAPPVTPADDLFCGPLRGTRDAHQASFGFAFEGYGYVADVTISEDGQRMTGRFHGASGFLDTPTAWLRVEPEAVWLPPAPDNAPVGAYDLTLLASPTFGDAYALGETYELRLLRDDGISGHLGSFWWSEASVSSDAISIGPVPATVPELPVQVEIQLQAGVPTHVQAVTAAGDEYLFAVSGSR